VIATALVIGHLPVRATYETLLVPTAFAAAAGIFVASMALGPCGLARGLSLRPLVWLGRLSYSLYLWHLPLLVAFAGVHRGFGVRAAAAVIAAVALAAGSRRFIELRFIQRRATSEEVGPVPAVAPA